ncbi:MAG TPA: beta-eliminating lyase-related protein [Bryobacteraceae bacterium]|nr:beta-eliminating lyase-related protein [Bryobacteraceae bacterium]
MRRRAFLSTTLAAFQLSAQSQNPDDRVFVYGDGIPHSPEEYARLLTTLAHAGIEVDDYSRGGIVEKLEQRFASILGKETAVWLPTGTLANHLAVRLLASHGHRVIVQADCHLYNDCGDCAETLSGLKLLPLATGHSTFTVDEVERAANDSLQGRVPSPIGAIQVETPVRRLHGQRFDFGEMQRVAAWARKRGIGLHLDGARLFLECAYTNRSVRDYAALFDTVYVSLYKYFNAASGAVLAGPKSLLGDLYNTRRMFGGGLPQVWPFAAVALHFVDGFEKRFQSAVEASEQVISALSKDSNFEVQRFANGTNVFRLRPTGVNAPVYLDRLETAGIAARQPVEGWLTMQVNETWNRIPPTELLSRFVKALG